ncbi:hypothetical protein ATETN484_0014000100 [Aspergillus terreus]|nr:hypothetical protein ATETN484_0014000100 [Aspergillus terreus]
MIDGPLEIIQYYAQAAKDRVMAPFLREARKVPIIAIQEPWRNPFSDTTHHPLKATHHLLHPEERNGERARVCLFVSKDIHPGSWEHQAVGLDYHWIRFTYQCGAQQRFLVVHNVYNDLAKTTLDQLDVELARTHTAMTEHVVVGDFNLHHPAWGGSDVPHVEIEAEGLLGLMDRHRFELLTEAGTATWSRGSLQSTIDLTWVSASLRDRLVLWERADDLDSDSDHYPLRTRLDVATTPVEVVRRRNWKKADVEQLISLVRERLDPPHLILSPNPNPTSQTTSPPSCRAARPRMPTPAQIDRATNHLIETLHAAIDETVPWARPSEWSNPDLTPECVEAIKETRQLRRALAGARGMPWEDLIERAYKDARNHKTHLVRKTLRNGHRQRVQEVTEDDRGLWKLSKWARNRSTGAATTPTLEFQGQTMRTPEAKAAAFRETFFPRPPPADLSNIGSFSYPEGLPFPLVTVEEVRHAIKRAPADKTPGDDGIPNRVLHWVLPIIDIYLTDLFNACLSAGYNPRHFQVSVTMVLRKPGKSKYTEPKAFRPVSLLNTIGKALESVVAQRLSYAVERFQLLPKNHLNGRKGVSYEQVLQIVVDRITKAWRKGRSVSLLLLDVSGAYDNVSHRRLLHNLRKRKLGHFVPWIASFLSNRYMRIRMPEHITELFPTTTGIPQGSPLSPILYLLYNADLIEVCNSSTQGLTATEAYGYVDDVALLAEAVSIRSATRALQAVYPHARQWASQHGSVFAPAKYKLVHFPRPAGGEPQPSENALYLNEEDITVQPSSAARYLGVWLDSKLDFSVHCTKMLHRAEACLEALRGIAGSTWGTSLEGLRRVYQAIVVPTMLYCSLRAVMRFINIQKRAAILISGSFRVVAAEALNIELFLTPIPLLLEQRAEEAGIRIATGPRLGQPRAVLSASPRRRQAFAERTFMEAFAAAMGRRGHHSGIQGYVGAAAVVPKRPSIMTTDLNDYLQRSAYIGGESRQTVYAAELRGPAEGAQLARRVRRPYHTQVVLFTDSQAAISALRGAGQTSGQAYLIRALDGLERLSQLANLAVEVWWIPAHAGVPGNKVADQSARQAALRGLGPAQVGADYLLAALRLEMRRKIDRVKGLLRNFDRYDYDQLVSEPKVVRLVANFVLATGLLQQFREVPKQADIEDDSGPEDIWNPFDYEGHDDMPIRHGDTTIQPSESARYLGIWLDKPLSFSTHRAKVLSRANSSLEALRSITGSTWGASLETMRAVYRGVVVPQLLYGVAAWFSPASRSIPATEQNKIINKFTKI